MRKYFIIIGLLSIFSANQALANTSDKCEIGAYTLSEANKKIPVKKLPYLSSKTIDYIEPIIDSDEIKGTDLIISEIKNNYARIFYTNQSQRAGNKYGWIETKYLGFRVQSEVAFSYPNIKAFPIYHGEYDAISNRNVKAIHSCKGEWLNMTFSPKNNTQITGWMRGICANQETSCDGLIGDNWNKY